MLTPHNIRNPKRSSGFDHVSLDNGGSQRPKPYRAGAGTNPQGAGEARGSWRGPRRATALEAAQDYCDYMNGNPSVATTPRNKSAGHGSSLRQPLPRDTEVEAALGVLRDARGQREGRQGYVYLIAEVYVGGGIGPCKVGYSTNPEARVAELQVGNPRKLTLLYSMPGTEADERRLHIKYADRNILLEWFSPTKELLLEFPAECSMTRKAAA